MQQQQPAERCPLLAMSMCRRTGKWLHPPVQVGSVPADIAAKIFANETGKHHILGTQAKGRDTLILIIEENAG